MNKTTKKISPNQIFAQKTRVTLFKMSNFNKLNKKVNK